jgi:hypothetical protein
VINRQLASENWQSKKFPYLGGTMTLKVDWLRGCATALVTPFTSEGAVDDRRLREFIEYQINGGVKVLVPCGTTGESVTMSDAENELVIRTTIELAQVPAAIPLLSRFRNRAPRVRSVLTASFASLLITTNRRRKVSTHTSARSPKPSTTFRS